MNRKLTHVDDAGKLTMVDIGAKPIQRRIAIAEGRIRLAAETLALIEKASIAKGDVIAAAEIAGIQAAKRAFELIPLCHPIATDSIKVRVVLTPDGADCRAEVTCTGRTGAEMEALTAVSVALLTIYDMCKAVDKAMIIENVHLVKKEKLS
jgi:cyclic pyranopterin monophosphate synthase